MTITPDTVRTQHNATPTQTHPVGTHRDASAAPAAPASSPADQLFAEGTALLDAGDHLGAADKVWQAAVTAMVTYSDARGWNPQDWHLHRMLLDIAKLRCQELGIPYLGTPADPDPVTSAYIAADTLEAHVAQDGHFLDLPEVRRVAERVRPILEIFRLD